MFTKGPASYQGRHTGESFRHRGRQLGITLVELILFMVIIGIALAGILNVMSFTSKFSADPQNRKQALSVAEALMEEVQLAHFTYCDPADANAATAANTAACTIQENMGVEAGNTRPYDNVNDYTNLFPVSSAFTDANGVAQVSTLTDYKVTLSVTPIATLGPLATPIAPVDGTPANLNVLLITVIVNYTGNNSNTTELIRLDGYRTRYAPNALP